jgi:hypothetical protein
MINGVEHKELRSTTGDVRYHNNSTTKVIPLQPGEQNIVVQYRTLGTMVNISPQNCDYHVVLMTVAY